MTQKRFSLLVAILGCLILASCQPGSGKPSAGNDVTQPSETTSFPDSTSADKTTFKACFSVREINPFALSAVNTMLFLRNGSGVQVVDLTTGNEETNLQAAGMVFSAALSPDGNTLAWSLEDNSIQLVRVSDGQILHTLVGHPDPVLHLLFSPNKAVLYSASHDGWVRAWDTENGTQLSSIQVGGEVVGFGVSSDGTQLATIPFDGPVLLWDLVDYQLITDLGGTSGYDTSEASFSRDGQYLIADLADGIYLWRIADKELVWNGIKNSMAVSYSPEGDYLAFSDIDNQNKVIISSPDGKEIIRELGSMAGPVWVLFFSPDGSMLVASDGIEIRIWQVSDGQLLTVGKNECP